MWGMITYGVPLERFPDKYNGQPLCYIGLAAQKNHFALYLMGAYEDGSVDRALRDGFARAGKKLDMGKSCLRFKRLDELPLDVIGQAVAAVPPETLMSLHDAQHGAKKAPAKRKPAAKKKTVKKTTAKKAAKTATTTKTARNSTTRR